MAQEIQDHWLKTRILTKKLTSSFINGKIDFFIQKFEKIYEKLEAKTPELGKSGQKVREFQNLLNKLRLQLEAAKENYQKAKEQEKEVSSLREADALFRQTRVYILKAHHHLIQARSLLRRTVLRRLKRERGFKPPTFSLGRRRSTN